MTSVALAVIVYAVGEGLFGGNGGIAAFVFGLALGHRRKAVARAATTDPTRGLQDFHRELVFLLRTFFFLYLGLRVNVGGFTVTAILGAAAFVAVFWISRIPSTAVLGRAWRLPRLDRRIVRATVARGMTDTVLILYAIAAGVIPPSEAALATDLLFLVVLVAAFASAVLVFAAERAARLEAREALRTKAPATTPAAAAAPLPRELDRAMSEFLADPIVRHGEID
jgi:NhaP-type Na+/H+ or K+/H+ antiporter